MLSDADGQVLYTSIYFMEKKCKQMMAWLVAIRDKSPVRQFDVSSTNLQEWRRIKDIAAAENHSGPQSKERRQFQALMRANRAGSSSDRPHCNPPLDKTTSSSGHSRRRTCHFFPVGGPLAATMTAVPRM
jgi:hypothetical protein